MIHRTPPWYCSRPGALIAGLLLAPFGWITSTVPDFLLLETLGAVAMVAHLYVNRAVKLADAAKVAPLQYMLLPWAIVLGYLFFGDLPQTMTLIGAAIIQEGQIDTTFFISHRLSLEGCAWGIQKLPRRSK